MFIVTERRDSHPLTTKNELMPTNQRIIRKELRHVRNRPIILSTNQTTSAQEDPIIAMKSPAEIIARAGTHIIH